MYIMFRSIHTISIMSIAIFFFLNSSDCKRLMTPCLCQEACDGTVGRRDGSVGRRDVTRKFKLFRNVKHLIGQLLEVSLNEVVERSSGGIGVL